MKIKIVTVYNSLNPGSFLQATSLYRAIENMGYEVYFLEAGIRNLKRQALLECIYLAKKLRFSNIPKKIAAVKKYSGLLNKYKITSEINHENDIFVLGSDEIWNLKRNQMDAHPILWGEGLNYNRTLSYAPSLNYACAEDILEKEYAHIGLERIYAVSVRDNYSFCELSKITNRTIEEVCDPTVLVYPEAYSEIPDLSIGKNFILVYIYPGMITPDEIAEIRKFAEKEKKTLLAFGTAQPWCDISVNGGPVEFLSYIKYADYVCTSTFHGTMLSIIMQKQFAVFGNENKKVKELLESIGINRHVDAVTFEKVILEEFDKEKVHEKLLEMREKGLVYLDTKINEIDKGSKGK